MIRLGTRGSQLALKQTSLIESALKLKCPDLETKRIVVKTTGDQLQGFGEDVVRDKRQWVQEIEEALLSGEVDIAIHSAKDVPVEIDEATSAISVLERANPRDVFIPNPNYPKVKFNDLSQGSIIGTASNRRRTLAIGLRPDLIVIPLRGNITTRLEKLAASREVAGIILASAGLERLGILPENAEQLSEQQFLPAVCQGILVGQYLKSRDDIEQKLKKISNSNVEVSWASERCVIEVLGADCRSAVGVYSLVDKTKVSICARVLSSDGSKCIERTVEGSKENAVQLGRELGKHLLEAGALELLN